MKIDKNYTPFKIIIFTCLMLFGLSSSITSQDAMFVDQKGNVGIAKNNPEFTLDVNGVFSAKSYSLSDLYSGWTGNNRKFISFERGVDNDQLRGRMNIFAPSNYYTNVPALTLLGNYGAGGKVGINSTTPIAHLDINQARSGSDHPKSINGLYVTGDFSPASNGVEFRHANGSQGVGIGYNSIYATGSNGDQDLNLMPRGSGKVGVGTTSPTAKLDVNGDMKAKDLTITNDAGKTVLTVSGKNANMLPAVGSYFRIGSAGQAVQDIYCRFTYFGTSYKPSDASLKENIVPLGKMVNASEIINSLKPVIFNWKDKPDSDYSVVPFGEERVEYGFVAQEVAELVPGAVVKMGADKKLAVNYEALYTILFEATRDQQKTIDALKNEKEEMQADMDQMKQDLESLKRSVVALHAASKK